MNRPAISVHELLQGSTDAGACGDILVRGLALDSRRVQQGDAFIALAGTQMHGIAFAPMAAARGASIVLAEKARDGTPASTAVDYPSADEGGVPIVWLDGLRDELGTLAARFFGEPSQTLEVIGVTGTNGKTSTVQLLAQALHLAGRKAATIGTLGAGLYGAIREGERTTPDAIAVQGLLAGFRDAGASHVAMEVSSHALEQGRVNAVAFDLAVFTNLSRDHLDYHGTMQAYGAAKRRLFEWPGLSAAIINADDAFGRTLIATVPARVRLLRYAIGRNEAEVVARDLQSSANGQRFHLSTPWGEGAVATRLLGRFNVSNLLAVAACLGLLGVAFAKIVEALGALTPVAGRMSRLGGAGVQPLIVVDYAHTPDALEQALTSLRAHSAGRLICVFGCGGERDAGKRPQMGAIAEALADRVIITDDNPRGEDGDVIVEQIVAGLKRPERATIERDRAIAIAQAIEFAQPGDIVLIAGKGHEPYQEIAGAKRPFDDMTIAQHALEQRAC
ncbi:MAG TPA: UDP-N-acetylmuramoyl-L-alanyl-D-glutamate--2,6-diaminopimelate ligase [Dokdonella sp.]